MNTKFLELAEQAGLQPYYDGQTVAIKKFADLIVKECLNNMNNCDGDLDFAVWLTKIDFGIE